MFFENSNKDATNRMPDENQGIQQGVGNGAETVSQLLDKHGEQPKRGRGRPKKDGSIPQSIQEKVNSPAANVPIQNSNQANLPPLDKEVISKSVESLLRVADNVICNRLYRAAFRISKDEGFAKGIVQDTALSKDEGKLISELTATVCERHQLLGQYAPEVLLCISLTGYATRQFFALKQIAELTRQVAELQKNPPDTVRMFKPENSGEAKKG